MLNGQGLSDMPNTSEDSPSVCVSCKHRKLKDRLTLLAHESTMMTERSSLTISMSVFALMTSLFGSAAE